MPDESKDFAKGISNETLCQYFYIVFVLISVMAGIVILVDIWTLGGKPRALFLSLLRVLPTFAVAIVNSLFLYLLCSRSLLK